VIVHLLDIEWLLSTLFDASLFNFGAAGNGGSFFVPFSDNRRRVRSQNHSRVPIPPSVVRVLFLATVAARQLCPHVRRPGAGQDRSPKAILLHPPVPSAQDQEQCQ
jgi:hypothetical protein